MSARTLPKAILSPEAKFSSDAPSVQQKFSKISAAIGEKNVDYEALRLMCPEAAMFWLPKFTQYLKCEAPDDSFHFDVLLSCLSDQELGRRWKAIATKEEIALILEYLNWLSTETSFLVGSELRRKDYDLAIQNWAAEHIDGL